LSTVEGDVSVVANGAWKGKSLTAIIDDAPVEILGTSLYQIWKTISVAFQIFRCS
jgi:mannose-6-phosphate isomerase